MHIQDKQTLVQMSAFQNGKYENALLLFTVHGGTLHSLEIRMHAKHRVAMC